MTTAINYTQIDDNTYIWPKLYKKNTKGGVEEWLIKVCYDVDHDCALINTNYGNLDGNLINTVDAIKAGKNVGRSNETSILQQGLAEADSKWTKKLKSGYVRDLLQCRAGAVDVIITGGVVPMLARSYSDDGDKIQFPCAGQPKLDGIRCIAVKKGKDVGLFSRTRKPITSCPHIINSILEAFEGVDVTLDGELYNHDYRDRFEAIVSAVRKDDPSPESLKVQYHIYDMVDEEKFSVRWLALHFRSLINNFAKGNCLQLVETISIEDQSQVIEELAEYKAQGYEGLMLRNRESPYENKRSAHLQKVKEFDDAEFEIIGVEEGRGKLQGLVGAYILRTSDGKEFKAKPTGDQEATKTHLQNPQSVIGRLLVVKYQGFTGKNGVPRFPVGLRIRDTMKGSIL